MIDTALDFFGGKGLFSKVLTVLLALSCAGIVAAGSTPKMMNAMVQNGYGGPEVMTLQRVPVKEPQAGQVLIRVYAAAVNPIDWKVRAKRSEALANSADTVIPGFDVSGVIEKTGPGVTGFQPGDPVFAKLDIEIPLPTDNGAYAEFAIAPAGSTVAKPENLTYDQAAGLGIVGFTANRGIHHANVRKGQRVFINGIAGGVGSAAAQIAKARGAYVIGTASARHHQFLESIGVDQIIDYTKVDFEDVIEDVDFVFDTVGNITEERAFAVLKKGGFYVGRGSEEGCKAAGVGCHNMSGMQERSGELLQEVADLVTANQYIVNIDRSYPLVEAGKAHLYGEEGHTQGKIVLHVVADKAKEK